MCFPSWTPSHLPPHPIPQGHPNAPALNTPSRASNMDWRSVSHMIIYKFQCYSVKSPHPRHLPQSPKDCSVHLCVYCCLAYRAIITIFLNSIYMHWYTILVLFFLSLTFEHCLASWHYQILWDCLVHFLPPVKNQPFLQGVLVPSTGHLYVVSQEAEGGQMRMSSLTDARMSQWPSKYLHDRLYSVQLGPQNMQASDTAKMITRFCPHPADLPITTMVILSCHYDCPNYPVGLEPAGRWSIHCVTIWKLVRNYFCPHCTDETMEAKSS